MKMLPLTPFPRPRRGRRALASRGGRSSRWCLASLLAGSLVVLGACTTAPGTAIHSAYGGSTPRLEPGPTYEIKAGAVAGLGTVLVDGEGLTLYLFEADRQGSPSTCVSVCAVQWPPVLVPQGTGAPVAGPGIKASLLGTAPRADGTTQVTYNGWPLYTWPQDTGPGQATGQALTNLGGRWYVLDVAGNAITKP